MNVLDKIKEVKWYAWLAVVAVLLAGASFFTKDATFGAGYAPVTGYESNTTARVSAGASTIPVASVKDFAGNTIVFSGLSASSTQRLYFNVEPGGSRQELFYCTGISGSSFTGCVGGLSPQGGSITASSTLQKAHPAGSRIISTNIGQFYANEFVSISGNQNVFDTKTFYSFPAVSSTSALPTSNDQLATKFYADSVIAGGLSASNVSTTLGLITYTGLGSCLTSGTCFGINASTTKGLAFGNETGLNKSLTVSATTTQFTFDHLGMLAIDTTKGFTWTGAHTFSAGLATVYVPTPVDPGQAANQIYVDNAASFGYATGTAGVTIAAGNALYISTTGTLFLADADASSTALTFVGIARTAGAAGAEVQFVKPGGVYDKATGLNIGDDVWLSGTPGEVLGVKPSFPTLPVLIGRAISASRFEVRAPSVNLVYSAHVENTTTDVAIAFGVIPQRVDLICGTTAGSSVSTGWWATIDGGMSSTTASWGVDDDAVPYTSYSNSRTCEWEEGASVFAANVVASSTSPSTPGFIIDINSVWAGAARDVTYTATYRYP